MDRTGDTIQFNIVKSLGVLGESRGGWKTELNLVSWNGKEPKYDVRAWDPTHQRMGKGLTFTQEEVERLHQLLGECLGGRT